MRKLIHYITPSFILKYNQHLLTHAPLGWQLQLPVIMWSWFLITLATLPVPFLYELDNRRDNDIEGVIFLGVMIAVLQLFLYVYILIQFNNTKSFGARGWGKGTLEQLAYTFVLLLSLSQLIAYPVIVEYRKAELMTEEEILREAKAFNQAKHYFMDIENNFTYFPDDSAFVSYIDYEMEPGSNKYQTEYYNVDIKPLMEKYIIADSVNGIEIPSSVTRKTKGPKLYYTGGGFLSEYFVHKNWWESTFSYSGDEIDELHEKDKYQLKKVSDAERLEQIKAFIRVYNKYQRLDYGGYGNVVFENPEDILAKYNENRFSHTQHYRANGEEYQTTVAYPSIDTYSISSVHSNIMDAKYKKLQHFMERLMVCFHVAFGLSMLLFLFKNNRLRDFILMFVYTGLLVLVVTIISVLVRDEGLAVHTPIIVFAIGLFILITNSNYKEFSSMRSILLMLSNLMFAYAWIFFWFYFDQYLRIVEHYDSVFCSTHSAICDAQERFFSIILWSALFGGPVFYLLFASAFYKRAYEKQWALPMGK